MSLKPLNHHYSMENPSSVYDEEAMTALELAGRTTAKVNETVQAFNQLETDTANHLNTQDKTIDTRMAVQDDRLTKMENVQIPNTVTAEMQERIDNGDFDMSIDAYAGNLIARVDNLLGSLEEGSTTGDAELIDARTGTDNKVHTNVGEAVRQQVDNLKGAINTYKGFYRRNLLTGYKPGYRRPNEIIDTASTELFHSDPFYLNKGDVVYNKVRNTFGSNNHLYHVTKEGSYLGYTPLTETDDVTAKFTAPYDGYYSLNITKNALYITTAPEYLGDTRQGLYLAEVVNPEVILNHLNMEIKRPNLVTDIFPGYYTGLIFNESDSMCHTNPIYLGFGDIVYATDETDMFGANSSAYLYNDDKSAVIRQVKPVETVDKVQRYEITYPGFYTFNRTKKTFCVTKNLEDFGTKPGAYLPDDVVYPDPSIFNNPIAGKTIVFDGDSICHGTSVGADDPTYGYGWAGRIGEKNQMEWYNKGISGGVITSGISADKHCLNEYIDSIITNYPNLDYLILEGGTNDADVLKSTGLGTFTAEDYSGEYDNTKFCGALETLFYKAVTNLPNTKIGFIIAPQMGVKNTSANSVRRRYFDKVIEICVKWGIPYIDLWNGNPLNPALIAHYNKNLTVAENRSAGSFYTDGQHLTAKGYDRITPQIEAWIKTL